MDVRDVTRTDIVRLLERIADAGKGTTANRVKAYLSKFLGWCQDRGIIEQSPMIGLKPVADENSRERPLSPYEVALLWNACEAEPAPYGVMFQMLLLTGQRRGEVAGMQWSDIDADGVWRLSSTKNAQRHDVPLPDAARRLLDTLPRLGPYVFTTNGKSPSTSLSKPHARIAARMAELAGRDIPHWTPHDVRHTVKTELAGLGIPLDVRSRLTNHLSDIPPMDRRYNHEVYEQEKLAALEKWSAVVLGLADVFL
jgi:integrase